MCASNRPRERPLQRKVWPGTAFTGTAIIFPSAASKNSSLPSPRQRGCLAARNRNGPLALARRKRPHVHFTPARPVRGEGHPMAVRRELAKQFVELGPQKWDWLSVRRRALGRENPKIVTWSSDQSPVDDEPAVPRPLSWGRREGYSAAAAHPARFRWWLFDRDCRRRLRFDAKTMRSPLGDQKGATLPEASLVNRVSVPRLRSRTQRSVPPLDARAEHNRLLIRGNRRVRDIAGHAHRTEGFAGSIDTSQFGLSPPADPAGLRKAARRFPRPWPVDKHRCLRNTAQPPETHLPRPARWRHRRAQPSKCFRGRIECDRYGRPRADGREHRARHIRQNSPVLFDRRAS